MAINMPAINIILPAVRFIIVAALGEVNTCFALDAKYA
jgi:hypothetical protein